MTKLAFVYIVLVFWENVIHIEHIGTTSTVKSFHRLFLNNPILVTEAWINYPQNNSQQQYSWLHTQKVSFKKIFTYNAVRVCHSSDSSGLRGCGLIDITFRLLHRNMWRHLLCVPPPWAPALTQIPNTLGHNANDIPFKVIRSQLTPKSPLHTAIGSTRYSEWERLRARIPSPRPRTHLCVSQLWENQMVNMCEHGDTSLTICQWSPLVGPQQV